MSLAEDIQPVKYLAMLKLMVQGEADIRAGRVADQNEVFSRIQARINIHREQRW